MVFPALFGAVVGSAPGHSPGWPSRQRYSPARMRRRSPVLSQGLAVSGVFKPYIYIYQYNLHTIVVYFHIVYHSAVVYYMIYIYTYRLYVHIYIFMYIVYMILNVYICTWCTDKTYCYNIVITRVFFLKHDLVGVYICIYTFAHIYMYVYIIPSGNLTSLLKMAMAIEIVDFPIKDGDFPFRYVHVYQRV